MSKLKDWADRRQCYDPDAEECEFLRGDDLLDFARETKGNKLILQFSRGKDSIAMWLYLREKGFEIVPYTMYIVPDLEHQEKSLRYYEEFFGQSIYRLPHPYFYYLLYAGIWMPPTDWATLKAFDLPLYGFQLLDLLVAQENDMDKYWCAMGMRRADNLLRMTLVDQCGVIGSRVRHFFYPIWDWRIADVCDIMDNYDVAIPADYEMFGSRGTTLRMTYRRLKAIKDTYPDDWAKMLEWFPLLDSQMFRYEVVGQ